MFICVCICRCLCALQCACMCVCVMLSAHLLFHLKRFITAWHKRAWFRLRLPSVIYACLNVTHTPRWGTYAFAENRTYVYKQQNNANTGAICLPVDYVQEMAALLHCRLPIVGRSVGAAVN